MKVVCFGAADGGKRLYQKISEQYEVIGFVDNDSMKWGGVCAGIKVYEPKQYLLNEQYDYVVITSEPGMESILKQLLGMGIDRKHIITNYVESRLEGRRVFLEKYAEMQNIWNEEGDVAEAGVFEGDFARYINEYFPLRKLHLFDTFEGFAESDLEKEMKNNYSNAVAGDYSNTSEKVVLEKMPYPEQVIIHKGFFPKTASNLSGSFVFVNLDLDLYEPTYQGLLFFRDKLSANGVILVHDYFARNFRGPREAVNRFVREYPRAQIRPIGDGVSVMIIL